MYKQENKILISLNPIMPKKYNMRKRRELREFEKKVLEVYKNSLQYQQNGNKQEEFNKVLILRNKLK